MNVKVETGVSADRQESSFMNATLQGVTDTHSMSIAVTLPKGAAKSAGVNLEDDDSVRQWMETVFASAIAQGCEIEVKVGPDEESEDDGE